MSLLNPTYVYEKRYSMRRTRVPGPSSCLVSDPSAGHAKLPAGVRHSGGVLASALFVRRRKRPRRTKQYRLSYIHARATLGRYDTYGTFNDRGTIYGIATDARGVVVGAVRRPEGKLPRAPRTVGRPSARLPCSPQLNGRCRRRNDTGYGEWAKKNTRRYHAEVTGRIVVERHTPSTVNENALRVPKISVVVGSIKRRYWPRSELAGNSMSPGRAGFSPLPPPGRMYGSMFILIRRKSW